MTSEIGLIGLAVMGQNLAFNIASHGFDISVYNRTAERVDKTMQKAEEEKLTSHVFGHKSLEDFVKSIKKPRKIIMLVQAGKAVDETIEKLAPLLDQGDLIIDGGNEWYENTERRVKYCAEKWGLKYLGMGVSGGEEGARHGPSLMPGGDEEAWKSVQHIFEKIAAQVPSSKDPKVIEPCVTYIGPRGAGNFVKMVHNGIEYGDMQLIAEIYDLMRNLAGFSNEEIAKIFDDWNSPSSELQSFLIEITAKIFTRKDPLDQNSFLVDKILDDAGSKGTGMWTIQEAAKQGVPIPTISAALEARYLSNFKQERIQASEKLKSAESQIAEQATLKFKNEEEKKQFVEELRNALYCAKICSYTQGLKLLQKMSEENNWNLKIGEIARIWKGGCIIRAIFLDRITKAFIKNPKLESLLMDDDFASEIVKQEAGWRKVVGLAIAHGIGVPALCNSLSYFDNYRRKRLPQNLTQAQRDAFGAHTFKYMKDNGSTEVQHYQMWL